MSWVHTPKGIYFSELKNFVLSLTRRVHTSSRRFLVTIKCDVSLTFQAREEGRELKEKRSDRLKWERDEPEKLKKVVKMAEKLQMGE